MSETVRKFSFERALGEIKSNRLPAVRKKINEILEVNNRSSFYQYKRGLVRLEAEKYLKLDALFKSEGVKNPWGKGDDETVSPK